MEDVSKFKYYINPSNFPLFKGSGRIFFIAEF